MKVSARHLAITLVAALPAQGLMYLGRSNENVIDWLLAGGLVFWAVTAIAMLVGRRSNGFEAATTAAVLALSVTMVSFSTDRSGDHTVMNFGWLAVGVCLLITALVSSRRLRRAAPSVEGEAGATD